VAGVTEDLDVAEKRDDGALVLTLRGDLDMAAEEVLGPLLRRDLPAGVHEVVVDLAEVGFLDSTGVRLLLEGRERALGHGAVLTVRNPRPVVLHVLRITSVAELFGLTAA
jgi:anti-sigma B factor antagonist